MRLAQGTSGNENNNQASEPTNLVIDRTVNSQSQILLLFLLIITPYSH